MLGVMHKLSNLTRVPRNEPARCNHIVIEYLVSITVMGFLIEDVKLLRDGGEHSLPLSYSRPASSESMIGSNTLVSTASLIMLIVPSRRT